MKPRPIDYLPLVRRIASELVRKLPPSIELDDLIQQGCLGLMQAASRYDETRNDNFPAYAVRRIRGAMLDSVRHREWRSYTCAPLEEATAAPSPEQLESSVDASRVAAGVRAGVSSLPAGERRVVVLYYVQGLTQEAIGARLGMDDHQVSAIRRQALTRLRTDLAHLRAAA